jgi:hypothetical protein
MKRQINWQRKELTLLSLDQNPSAELARVLPRPQFISGLRRNIKKMAKLSWPKTREYSSQSIQ